MSDFREYFTENTNTESNTAQSEPRNGYSSSEYINPEPYNQHSDSTYGHHFAKYSYEDYNEDKSASRAGQESKEPIQDVNFVIVDEQPLKSSNDTANNSHYGNVNSEGSYHSRYGNGGFKNERISQNKSESFENQYNSNFDSTANAEFGSPQKPKKPKKTYTFTFGKGSLALILVFFMLLSTLCGYGGAILAEKLDTGSQFFGQRASSDGENGMQVQNPNSTTEEGASTSMTVEQIASLNENSVVEIRTESIATDMWLLQYITEGAGSGVIISSDGYIVTNNHVIEDSSKITVTLKNGEAYTAKLVGRDDETDLAVLKISAKGLTPVVYGDSSTLKVGDMSVIIGNPLGNLGGTVTAGIISALDRSITIDGKTMTLLQTDASINPGNSGGGMFNDNGELVGVVVAKSSGSDVEGLGFAIPVNKVKKIAQELADYGYVRGRIDTGMTFLDLTSMRNAIFYGVPNLGIYVKSVDTQLADSCGFKSGDMIYYVGNQQIQTPEDLTNAFDGYEVGDSVQITVVRNNQMKKLTLILGEKKGA